MRAKLLLGAAALVAAVITLHTTVLEKVAIGGVKPDLLLAIVVYVSLAWGAVAGVVAGFVLGLLQDAQAVHGLGLNALSKAAAGYAVRYTWEALDKESVVTQMAVIFGAGMLHGLIFWTLYSGSEVSMIPRLFVRMGLPGALYTAAAAPLLVALLQRMAGFRMRLGALPRRQR